MSDDTDGGSAYTDNEIEEPASPISRSSRSKSASVLATDAKRKKHHDAANVSGQSEIDRIAPKTAPRSKQKRLTGCYSNAYGELYNETITALGGEPVEKESMICKSSQIGVSTWSVLEKEVFFRTLATLGKDNIQGLAAAINGKSEAEVQDYRLLLHEATTEALLKANRTDVITASIPAALEVRKDCEDRLNLAAEALAWQVERQDQRKETKRYGEYWLLTRHVAHGLDEVLASQSDVQPGSEDDSEDGSPQHTTKSCNTQLPVPSANLLNLHNWLQLSELFMNQAPDLPFGWRSLVETEDETPSIYRTAFDDFQTLTISLTKRLIQASIFQAMSRIRATDQNKPAQLIRREDVEAAVDILDLHNDWDKFWVKCARRNGLQIYTDSNNATGTRPRLGKGFALDYEEVETALLRDNKSDDNHGENDTNKETTELMDHEVTAIPTIEDEIDEEEVYDNSDFWTLTSSSEPEDDPEHRQDLNHEEDNTKRRHRRTRDPYAEDIARDAHTDALDLRASRAEERRLWALLGEQQQQQQSAETIENETPGYDMPPLPPPPPPTRKRQRLEELRDWRDSVAYVPQWEAFETPVREAAFVEMAARGVRGRKRRREAYERIAAAVDEGEGEGEGMEMGTDSDDGRGGDGDSEGGLGNQGDESGLSEVESVHDVEPDEDDSDIVREENYGGRSDQDEVIDEEVQDDGNSASGIEMDVDGVYYRPRF